MRRILHAEAPLLSLTEAREGVGIHARRREDWPQACALASGARARGLSPIGVLSPTPPAPADLAEAAACGVTELGLVLRGARVEVHDWHTGERGSFVATLEALAAARTLGMRVGVATVVTRSNARVLSELPSLLKASGASLWVLAAARADGDGFTARVPRLGLGVPAALSAMERGQRVGLPTRTAGFPTCTLGPFASSALPSAPRGDAAPCAQCSARAGCPGIDAAYAARFGAGELRALSAPADPGDAAGLASLFLGVDAWLD